MRPAYSVSIPALVSGLLSTGLAHAEDPAPSAPTTTDGPADSAAPKVETTAPPEAEAAETSDAPPARTGFQLGIRTGLSIPVGDLERGSKMSDAFGVQVPIFFDIGGKVIPQLFVGAYLGLAFGGVDGTIADVCNRIDASCLSVGFRLGVQAQYHILPAGKLNPWVGYGIGIEGAGFGGERNGRNKFTGAVAGWEYAHLMAGLDFRLSRTVGLGPYLDFAIGEYKSATLETTVNGVESKRDGDILNTASHQWLTLGAKFTLFP